MNGVIGEVDMSCQSAADNRHPPIIKRVPFPSVLKVEAGELLFKASTGAAPSKYAVRVSAKEQGNSSKTSFTLDLKKAVVPGTGEVALGTDICYDNGDGTIGSESLETVKGHGTIDYATGKIAFTAKAAPSSEIAVTGSAVVPENFGGVADETLEGDGVNAVLHGTIVEGIAKISGIPATEAVMEYLSRHGIY